ncbi:hypothetical protein THAOC_30927, partial [Thalassiosira oceanica]
MKADDAGNYNLQLSGVQEILVKRLDGVVAASEMLRPSVGNIQQA